MRFDPNARLREQDLMTTDRLDNGSSAEVVALCWFVLFFSSASTIYEITRTRYEKTFGGLVDWLTWHVILKMGTPAQNVVMRDMNL